MNTKISVYGRLLYALVMGTLNNKNLFRKYGAIAALRNSQNTAVTSQLNPEVDASGHVTVENVSGRPVPVVIYEFDPFQAWGGTNDYTDLTTATKPAEPLNAKFYLSKVRESAPILITWEDWRSFEKEAEALLDKLNSDNVESFGEAAALINKFSSGAKIKRDLTVTMERGFFAPVNNYCLTQIAAGAGKNPLYTSSAAGDAISISLLNSASAPTLALTDDMDKLLVHTKMEGRWIVLAGSGAKLSTYFNRLKVAGLNNDGIDLGKLVGDQAVDIYYDQYIDATLGNNHFFLIAPGSAALVPWNELAHCESGDLDAREYVYSALRMPAFDLDLDLRLLKNSHVVVNPGAGQWVDPHPRLSIAPSLRYNVWTKPQGFHYADNTDPLYAVNGIYHYVVA